MIPRATIMIPLTFLLATVVVAQGPAKPGQVLAQVKVSESTGGFTGAVDPFDGFGRSLVLLGDVDGDGTDDIATGAPFAGDAGLNVGFVWILFMLPDGTVRDQAKIGVGAGGFPGTMEGGARFGAALAPLGDLNGDQVPDLAVGSPGHNDSGSDRGSIWILFLNSDGTVQAAQEISSSEGDFVGPLVNGDFFGWSLASVGDFDGDTVTDLAVGAIGDNGGGVGRGAIWLLFLGSDGRVDGELKIGAGSGGFGGVLANQDAFGSSVTAPGDVDGDGTPDLVVGAAGIDPAGGIWTLFLEPNGTVRDEVLIADGMGDFMGDLEPGDSFGVSLCATGDLNGDGVPDVASGAYGDDDGGLNSNTGAVWFVFLSEQGLVEDQQKVSPLVGGFSGPLDPQDGFGYSLGSLGDFDGDGRPDVACGAAFDDDGGLDQGAFYVLYLDAVLPPEVTPYGCDVNPAGSLTVADGQPSVGTMMTLALDNPFGTQAAGSSTAVFASIAPDPSHPCGTVFPGWGMSGAGADGELLVSLAPQNLAAILSGPPWGGVGVPALIQLSVPNNPALLGLSVFLQGVIWDPAATQGVGPAWTSAVELRVGP